MSPSPSDRVLLESLLASGELSQAQAQQAWSEAQQRGVSVEELLATFAKPPQPGGSASGSARVSDSLLLSDSRAHLPASQSMEGLPPHLLAALSDPQRPRLGRYVLLDELGRGAMGVVHRAFDPELRREVAIKQLLNLDADEGEVRERRLKRFQLEGRATAKLRHPNLVAVYEVGSEGGRPYLVMDYVEGQSFEDVLARQDLSPRRVAEIVAGVARGLGHAHAAGLVHRDVKPGNILIDSEGQAKLTDFGLARDAEGEQGLSRTGQILGTPLFLSPEQALGMHAQTGPPADVFALGGVLYFALTGAPPFPAEGLMELVGKIVDQDPVPPSKLAPQVNRDLETIILTCLAKDAPARYADGAAVAEELERFLRGEAIQARPLTRLEWLRRAARRNRALSAVVLLSLLVVSGLLAAGVAGGLYSIERIQDERDEARRQRDQADEARRAAEASRQDALAAEARAREAESQAHLEATRARSEGDAKGIFLSRALAQKGARLTREMRFGEAAALFAASLELTENEPARSGLVTSLGSLLPLKRPWWHTQITGVSFPAQGSLLSCDDKGMVRLSPTSGSTVSWLAHPEGASAVASAEDGRFASGSTQGAITLWAKPKTPQATTRCQVKSRVVALAFRPQASALAAALVDGVWIWDLAGEPRRLAETPARALVWSPSGDALYVGTAAGRILRFDAGGTAQGSWLAHTGWVSGLAFDAAGRLCSAGLDARVRRWKAEDELEAEFVARAPVTALARLRGLEPGGMAFATSGGALELWRGEPLKRVAVHSFHRDLVYGVACAPDGAFLASGGSDGLLGVIRMGKEEPQPAAVSQAVLASAISPSGGRVVVGSWIGTLMNFDRSGRLKGQLRVGSAVRSLSFWSEDQLVVGTGKGQILCLDLANARRTVLSGHAGFVSALARHGQYLLSASGDGTLRWWDLARGVQVRKLDVGAPVESLDVSRQGEFALVGRDNVLRVIRGGKVAATLPGVRVARWTADGERLIVGRGRNVSGWDTHTAPKLIEQALSPITALVVRGDTLVCGSQDGLYTVLDLARSVRRARLRGAPATRSNALALGPEVLLGPGPQGSLCLWDLRPNTPFELLPMGRPAHQVRALPGGLLLVGGSEGRLEVYDPERKRLVRKLTGHRKRVLRIAVDAEGWIASGDEDGAVHVWAPNEDEPRHSLRMDHPISSVSLRGEGSLLVGAGGRVETWAPRSGRREEWRALPSESATALAATWRAVGGSRGRVVIERKGQPPEVLRTNRAHNVVALSGDPSGRYLAAATVGVPLAEYMQAVDDEGMGRALAEIVTRRAQTELHLWDTHKREGYLVQRREGLRTDLVFSDDGRLLVDAGEIVCVYDVQRGAPLAVLPTAASRRIQRAVCFLGRQALVTSYTPTTLALWDLEALGVLAPASELVERVHRLTGFRVVGTDALVIHTPYEAQLRRSAGIR